MLDLKRWLSFGALALSLALAPLSALAQSYPSPVIASLSVAVANAGTTGTTLHKLAMLTGAPSTAVLPATTNTSGILGIVVGGAGTTGNALITTQGQASCVFDGSTTAGDYFQTSSTTAGDCHDAGSSYPTAGQVLGRVLSTNSGAGTYGALIFPPEFELYTGTLMRSQSTPASPTGTTSSTGVMAGLAGSFTPAVTGKFLLVVSVVTANTSAGYGCSLRLRYGTGTAPTNGAALTGTVVGNSSGIATTGGNANQDIPVMLIGNVSGLTVGTAYWFDVSEAITNGGTCSLFNPTLIANEQ